MTVIDQHQRNDESAEKFKNRTDDRRQHPRYPLYTAVTVLKGAQLTGMFWAKDLSLGGALLFGHARIIPGLKIKLLLHLPWYKPIVLNGLVLRKQLSDKKNQCFAIRFMELTRSAQWEIQQAIGAAEQCTHRTRVPAVLLVTENISIVRALERQFYFTGIHWVLAQTPLDAVQWLQDWEVKIDTVLVDLSIEKFNVLTMLKFLAEEHGEVRRILISDEQSTTLERVAISYGKINAVLKTPIEQHAIASALTN